MAKARKVSHKKAAKKPAKRPAKEMPKRPAGKPAKKPLRAPKGAKPHKARKAPKPKLKQKLRPKLKTRRAAKQPHVRALKALGRMPKAAHKRALAAPPAAPNVSLSSAGRSPLSVPPIQPIIAEEYNAPKMRAKPGELAPALDLLPEWVDRSHLHDVVQEDGLSFAQPGTGSADYTEAQAMLSKCREADASLPGYFVICAKGGGKLTGAMDACVAGDILVVLRSFAVSDKKRDIHLLMHSCALGVARPAYVACYIERPDFSDAESAGRMLFIGRGLGMSALPFAHQKMLFFLRRMGKEYDPLSSGEELARVAAALKPLCPEMEAAAVEIASKGVVPLVLMPASPDRLERLRELKDAAIMLDLPADKLDAILESLKIEYVLSRIDITPPAI